MVATQTQAFAEPLPPLTEPDEPLSVAGATYETLMPALGEVFTEPLAVTDAELTVGSSDVVIALAHGGPILFVVDDDLAQCPDAQFTTPTGIQQAVAAAPPGSRIRVCAGTYTPINVNKPLILEHPVQHGQATQCKAALPPDPTKDAIIDAGNSSAIAVTLGSNDIVLYGFHVQNSNGSPGIYTLPAFSGYQLLFNVIQRNTFGLYLNASGATASLVSHNCFRENNNPVAAAGNGIYSDQGLRNALIEENYFTGHNSAAMVFALNQQDITVEHNDIVADAGSIVLVSTLNALVRYNHQVDIGGSGVFISGGVSNARIEFNRIVRGSTGVQTNNIFNAAPNTGIVVLKNHIKDGRFDGIRFNATSGGTIEGNKVEGKPQHGIRLQNGSNGNLVKNNLSRDNVLDGMRVDGGVQSSGNTIEQNKMHGNGEHDCHDDTVGTLTAGTANYWIKDIGRTENRPGLCKNAT